MGRPNAGLRAEVLAVIALLGVLCLIALPGMSSPRMLDDIDQMKFVARFRGWGDCFGTDAFGLFRPVKNLIFFGLGDIPVADWHCLNLLVYLSAVAAVYVALRRLLQSPAWALLGTSIWATCPTQTSAAIWMSCVNISLAIVLICACLCFHDLSRDANRRADWQVGVAVLCLFLALCSYESAVMVPALCLLVDVLRRRPVFSKESMIRYGMYGFVTLVYLWIRFHAGAFHGNQQAHPGFAPDLAKWQLSVSAPWLLWKHFSMWLMPPGRIEFLGTYVWGISASPAALAGAWAWLLGLVTIIVVARKREPWLSFGLLWFIAASFPTSNFIPIWAGPVEDYYLVIPSIGLSIALLGCARQILAWISARPAVGFSQRSLAGGAILGVGLIWRALGIPLFWYQSCLWNRPAELYLNCDLTRPGQYEAQGLAAREIFFMGKLDQAEELAKKSYATAPWYSVTTVLLGKIELSRKNYDEAIRYFDETIKLEPGNSDLLDYCNLNKATALMARQETRHRSREILLPILTNARSPLHLDAVNLLADYYLGENKLPEARKAIANGIRLHPDDPLLPKRLESINSEMMRSNESKGVEK